MMQGLVEMNQQIHYLVIFALGIFALFVLTTVAVAIIWNVVHRWFRNGKGTRRADNSDWPSTMVESLTRIDTNTENMAAAFSRNGFARKEDIQELKTIIREQHQ